VIVVGDVVAPDGEPVIRKVYEPGVTEDATWTVISLLPVGVTGLTTKLPQVMPVGRPEHDNVTCCAVPAVRVAVTVTTSELPAVILTGPSFDNE